jgi:geranylgeranyl pyrophosphate synthase
VRAGDTEAAARVAEAVRDSGACHDVRVRAREETDLALAALETVPQSVPRDVLGAIASELASRAA